MVFLFIFFTVFIIFIVIIIFSKIIIGIDNLQFTSQKNKNNKRINSNYNIIIKIKIFNEITILKKIYTEKEIDIINKKIKLNNRIKNIDIQKIIEEVKKKDNLGKKVIKDFLKEKFEIENINLKLELGTKEAAITAILVGSLSTIISLILRFKIKEKEFQTFRVIPIYKNQNIINISISGIFGIKVIHIINIIYILFKEKGENKYERTSNRKSYGYSYE